MSIKNFIKAPGILVQGKYSYLDYTNNLGTPAYTTCKHGFDFLKIKELKETILNSSINLFDIFGFSKIYTATLTHSNKVVNVDDPKYIFESVRTTAVDFLYATFEDQEVIADALISKDPNKVIAVNTADCIPVLIYDPVTGAKAAVHSGWKGTVKNITNNTISKMVEDFGINPKNLKIQLGPHLQKHICEMGDDVIFQFINYLLVSNLVKLPEVRTKKELLSNCTKYITYSSTPGKYLVDLQSILVDNVKATFPELDNSNFYLSDYCTYTSPSKQSDYYLFHSHRRDKKKSGRILSFIK